MRKQLLRALVSCLLLVTKAHAEKSSGESKAALQIMIFDLPIFERKQPFTQDFEASPQGLGRFDGGKSHLAFDRISARTSQIVIHNFEYVLEARNWAYAEEKAGGLVSFGLECTNIRLRYRNPEIRIQLPSSTQTTLVLRDGELRFGDLAQNWDPFAMMGDEIFSAESLAQNLRLEADCPVDSARQILERGIQTWLQRLPRNQPELRDEIARKFHASIQNEVRRKLHVKLPDAIQALSFEKPLALKIEELADQRAWKLSLGELELSARAQEIFENPSKTRRKDDSKAKVRVAANAAAINALVKAAIYSLKEEKGRWFDKKKILHIPLKSDYIGEELRPFYPELRPEEDKDAFDFNVSMADCKGQSNGPNLRPWLSEDSESQGLSIDWTFRLELTKKKKTRAVRRGHIVGDLVVGRQGKLSMQGGQAQPLTDSDPCPQMEPVASEIGASMEWFLNSAGLQDALDSGFQKIISNSNLNFEVRVLGDGLNRHRRPRSASVPGFWAEALRIDFTTPAF